MKNVCTFEHQMPVGRSRRQDAISKRQTTIRDRSGSFMMNNIDRVMNVCMYVCVYVCTVCSCCRVCDCCRSLTRQNTNKIRSTLAYPAAVDTTTNRPTERSPPPPYCKTSVILIAQSPSLTGPCRYSARRPTWSTPRYSSHAQGLTRGVLTTRTALREAHQRTPSASLRLRYL